MSRNHARPLSPHLTIWRWGPHMLVSILHRVTGSGLATVGTGLFVWWLAAIAGGADSYASFVHWVIKAEPGEGGQHVVNILARLVGLGLTWAFFQHLANGVRHLFLDAGANFELRGNKTSAIATLVFSIVMTVLVWGYILGVKG
ncbi:succinate dehydrogenase, cytochrome b556 subunit [Sphingomonas sp. ID0503]|uniref:succinate dehydrogenase, cytochrome b556 subunit n=1 Tax=Sphingomonas sp. ID0503 TaxID=3399691 RepID=UPI003AFA699E